MAGSPIVASWIADPAPQLRGLIRTYRAARYDGFAAGVHLGHPSRNLEFIVCLGRPIEVNQRPGDGSVHRAYTSLTAGLHTGPMSVLHGGSFDNVSLELTPWGARALFGMPAAELANRVVTLDDALGCDAAELAERMAGARDRAGCFAVLDEILGRRAVRAESVGPDIGLVWRRILASGGTVRISELVEESGYSRRHLTALFTGEYGITPKQAARIVRFERSRNLLRSYEQVRRRRSGLGRIHLADIAAECGYYDQAHLAREWSDLGGLPPSAWLAAEELPFAQAGGADETEVSGT